MEVGGRISEVHSPFSVLRICREVRMSKIAFITLGCKVNQYDTQRMRELARQNGYMVVTETEQADIYVVNTCTVTHTSDRKARRAIRKIITQHPDAKVIVTGCYADSDRQALEKIAGVALVFGNRDKDRLVEYLHQLNEFADNVTPKVTLLRANGGEGGGGRSNLNGVNYKTKPSVDSDIIKTTCTPVMSLRAKRSNLNKANAFDGRTRALVKVQDGCNTFCTYCIVPYVRGRISSRPLNDIIREVEVLARNGYKEVVITGVHLGAYGKDMRNDITVADILEHIHQVDGIERIRLSSIEPMDVPDDFIERVAHLPKCAPHFHLPLQSGNDEILRRMGRRYTVAEYARLVEKLRATFSDVGITTDIMVGFPGETDAQFTDTYNFIQTMAFSRLHVFRYSPREGTPAARYPDQVPPHISTARGECIRKLGDRLAEAFRMNMLGKEMEVLVEESREGTENLLAGFTGNYIRVLMDVPNSMINQMVRVRLTELTDGFMRGEIIK